MKKIVIIAALLVLILISCTGCYNKQPLDTTHDYDRAIVYLPNGEIVEGRVSSWTSWTSWTSFGDGGAVQIKIDGKTYLTHICNVCLIDD